ncbi:polysaccharide lyase 6 family protein [Persicobacter psychrovividus]|uniref:Alginate lyase n=1 Tax=Persicobacter psychrovividus TaxID=387638 RepID=A0ABN6LGP2_9BACT|nr:hypothetical protein PEPS_32230 [Persicobacter psychrovividus]
MKNFFTKLSMTVFLAAALGTVQAKNVLVKDMNALKSAVKAVAPGDTISLASGRWVDAKIKLDIQGTEQAGVVVQAQETGKTFLTGNSSLEMAGEYFTVKGLIFTDGYAKGRAAVRFRIKSKMAKHVRMTEVVMDHYNPADRFEKTSWVELYGQHNEIDHCYFGGKLNAGVLMAVRLNYKESRENYHQIHNNIFGSRPKLGSNGGETLRVGTSTYANVTSATMIENNIFDHCSGEVEVVSIKSSDNTIKGNVFRGCEGVMTMRHGDRNKVLGNYFLGEELPNNSGGLRIINGDHEVKGNYFQNLGGRRFFAPLGIMNGVPNSLANRYIRAHHVTLEDNHLFNCPRIELCVGSDRERTQTPDHIVFKNNTFYNPNQGDIFTKLDDISGFTFKGNKYVNNGFKVKEKGMKAIDADTYHKTKEGLWASKNFTPELPVKDNEAGPQWYTPISDAIVLTDKHTKVANYEALAEAIANAENGETIEITADEIRFMKGLHLTKFVNIVYKGEGQSLFHYLAEGSSRQPFFTIENGGSLKISGIKFNGRSDTGIVNAGISTSTSPMIQHYTLNVENCTFQNFDGSDYCAFRAYTSTFADEITFQNCLFTNISGVALNINGQTEKLGRYSAEQVTIENCTFDKVMTGAMAITRMGNDESTTGPAVVVKNCDFIETGNKELGSAVLLWGVQQLELDGLFFYNSGASGRTIRFEDPLWAISKIDHILSINSGRIESYYKRTGEHIYPINKTMSRQEAMKMKSSYKTGLIFGTK